MSTPTPLPTAPRRRLGFGRRLALGALLVVVLSAAAVAAFGIGQLDTLIHDIGSRGVKVQRGVLAPDRGLGGPETLLLVGNDTRSVYRYYHGFVPNLANESLLVRLDPAQKAISLFSIPRELLTSIDCPRRGVIRTRFNYALACGGLTTLVKSVKQVTGLSVNHVMEINFANFEKAIDQLGCVYYQVDERYYHVNVPGGPQYQEINLQPGYQKLCGTEAKEFVSYRHSDTSLVRDARDQTFLLAARKQFSGQLLSNPGKFERIFGSLVSADASLKTLPGIENLIAAVVGTAGLPTRQVQVQHVDYAPTDPVAIACACVTAPASAIRAAAYSFFHGTFVPPTRKIVTGLSGQLGHHRGRPAASGTVALSLTPTAAADQASAQALQSRLGVRVEFPTVRLASGANGMIDFRRYLLRDESGQPHPAFVEVFPVGLLGQYYDVEGTTWTGAPALATATATVDFGHTTYYLTFTGQHIDRVAWLEHHAAYWIENSLTDGVSNAQMLAIAEQTVPVSGPVPVVRTHLRLAPVAAPRYVVTSKPTGGRSLAAKLAGAVGIVGFLALLVATVLRRRRLRAMSSSGTELDARLDALEVQLGRLQARALGPAGRRMPPPVAGVARSAPSRSTSPGSGPGRRTPVA